MQNSQKRTYTCGVRSVNSHVTLLSLKPMTSSENHKLPNCTWRLFRRLFRSMKFSVSRETVHVEHDSKVMFPVFSEQMLNSPTSRSPKAVVFQQHIRPDRWTDKTVTLHGVGIDCFCKRSTFSGLFWGDIVRRFREHRRLGAYIERKLLDLMPGKLVRTIGTPAQITGLISPGKITGMACYS